MKKSSEIYGEEKIGGSFVFLGPCDAYKIAYMSHVVSMLYGIGRKKLI
jgi:hypothetical protein